MGRVKNMPHSFMALAILAGLILTFGFAAGNGEAASARTAQAGPTGAGALHYSGAVSGTFRPPSVTCTVTNGKITSVSAPGQDDRDAPHLPRFIAVIGDESGVTFGTAGGTFVAIHITDGLQTMHKDGRWVIAVDLSGLPSVRPKGGSVQVTGRLVCGHTRVAP